MILFHEGSNISLNLILNRKSLEQVQGPSQALEASLSAYEFALQDSSPKKLIERATKLNGSQLILTDLHGTVTLLDLDNFDSIYIVGAGKATAAMSNAVSCILKARVSGGAITVPRGIVKGKATNLVEITEAGHPLPDRAGTIGTKKIIDVLRKATQEDLVFCLISGGGSSLLPLPIDGMSLKAKRDITRALLSVGASITEINTIRKHLSQVKGGRLMKYVTKGCTVVTLIMSDVIGDPIDGIASGPTVPDNSTYGDCANILKKYGLWQRPGSPVIETIKRGLKGKIEETPKEGDPVFKKVYNIVIGNNTSLCNSAVRYLEAHVDLVRYLGSSFSGEAKEFGTYLTKLGGPILLGKKSIALVLGGETTVRLNPEANGVGGRNQEAILSAALNWKLPQNLDLAIICMSTDGIDGNSRAAGAVLTSRTVCKIKKSPIDLKNYLRKHDSYSALKKMGAVAVTQKTGTNLNDIAILCFMGRYSESFNP